MYRIAIKFFLPIMGIVFLLSCRLCDKPCLTQSLPLNTPTTVSTPSIASSLTPTDHVAVKATSTMPLNPEPTAMQPTEPTSTPNEPIIIGPPLPADITLPPGFTISIYASNISNARSMARSPNGTLFVGTRQAGQVYALLDTDEDYQIDQGYVIAQGLAMPNGVAFRDGSLYVAEVNRILRYDDIEAQLSEPPSPVVVNDDFPRDRWHGWKYLRFGPDGLLYVPVGGPCNVCETFDGPYGSIMRLAADGSNLESFALGVRNTVGFDWHPQTQELWFTDNGRDNLGDDVPPDELNHAPEAGLNFGFPYCHGNTISDPEFGHKRDCAEFTPPVQALGPHVAALGMRFYTGMMFPAEYQQQIFIAEHGSWNRTVPIGYRITLVRLSGNQAQSYEVFASGWLQGEQAWGRPVDLLILPDGSLLVSDDAANMIYRITYQDTVN